MSHRETRVTMQLVNEAAGSAVTLPPMPNPFTEAGVPSARLVKVAFAPDADLPADGTNNMSLTARNLADDEDLSAGIGNASEALSKGEQTEAASMEGARDIARGSSVVVKKANNGTGALAKGTLVYTWEANRHAV